MKNKALVIIAYAILGIPVPFSLISLLGSVISLANIGMMTSKLVAILAIITMLLAGTYPITYAFSLHSTIKRKRLNIYSFAPVFHIVFTILFSCIWVVAGKV